MRKSIVRITGIICAGLMIMSCFAGCSKSKSADAKTSDSSKELEIAVFEGGYGKAYYEEIIKKFEAAHPGVKVKMTASPKIEDIIKPRIIAGNPPDVLCEFGESRLGQLAAEGAVCDLTEVFESKLPGDSVPLKDKILDNILDGPAKPLSDGKIYYAPITEGASGLYYNKEYFEKMGWKAPKTWDEFFALGELAKKQGKALFTYQGIYPDYNELILMPAIASAAGMDAVNKIADYEEGAWEDPNVKKVLNIFQTIAQKGYLMKGTVAMNHTQAQTEFLKGNALFIPCGSWFENEMKDAIPKTGFKLGFIPAPVFNATDKQYISAGCGYFAIPSKAKNIALAKEFIKFQYTQDAIKLMAEKNNAVVAVKGTVNNVKDIVSPSVYDTFKAYDYALPLDVTFKETPATQVKIKEVIYKPINSIMNKEMTVDQWVEKIEKADTQLREAIQKAK